MGRDGQPKTRQKKALGRKKERLKGFNVILIVCEGEKTEPNYFSGIRKSLRISNDLIIAEGCALGTLPQQIVDYAYQRYRTMDPKPDQVFCVFDRDDHINFDNALSSAEAKKYEFAKKEKLFLPVPSVPCFELWLLIHFESVASSIERADTVKRLKQYIQEYEKSDDAILEKTRPFLEKAYENAARITHNRSGTRIENPYTRVDELVKILMKYKDRM